ncbi:MAG: SDR family NAD(P)-dependent oxidoreductase [Pseudomonadota bacterium]
MIQSAPKHQKRVWITGASSGLGRSLAFALANDHWLVYASARNDIELKVMADLDERIIPVPCDITDSESVMRVAAEIDRRSGGLERVILNAGSCEYLDFPEPDWGAVRRVMEINYFGTVNCVQAALPLLRNSQGRKAQLVIVASQVTGAPFPRAEAYGASKAALQYFSESLRIDLAPENIDVTVVNPGFVDTPLTRQNDFDMPFLMPVEEASQRIVSNIESHPDRYTFPWRLRALLSLSKLMPGSWRKMVATDKTTAARSSGGIEP